MKHFIFILTLFSLTTNTSLNIKTMYNFTQDPIDVVIPCHEKDTRTLELAIKGIIENGSNIRKVIVVSEKQLSTIAEWAPESIFPFTKKDLAMAIANGNETICKQVLESGRIGWIYQQFLKLYAPFVIKNISPNVLILDSDTIFLNHVEFMNKNGEPYFNVGKQEHKPYFEHCAKLLDAPYTIKRVYKEHSGICNYMLFQRPVLEDLFEKIEDKVGKKSGKKTWEIICSYIKIEDVKKSCMSEYEIYFNFIMARTNQAKIKPLKWDDTVVYSKNAKDRFKNLGYDYISCHAYRG
ncbi:MAG: hypothetical protein UR12_C0013G0003 [candidate division TM6 bacterium GW2011_GWF2_30_66]|nr:MAG: hypothetical protein UR12_C0013G0003 [candidate division TM6 bacterium GW2011_GWF2_30_66]